MYLAQILRLLSNNHIFREVTPDVFASNRLSSVLDTGKPSEEIVAKCVFSFTLRLFHSFHAIYLSTTLAHRHIGTSGIAAFAAQAYVSSSQVFFSFFLTFLTSVRADEVMKASSYLSEAFLDPKLSVAIEPTETPWNRAFGTNMSLFEWFNQDDSENAARSQRFVVAMAGTTKMEPETAILSGAFYICLELWH